MKEKADSKDVSWALKNSFGGRSHSYVVVANVAYLYTQVGG